MRKTLLLASLAALIVAPAIGLADDIVIKPEVNTWVMKQNPSPGYRSTQTSRSAAHCPIRSR